MYVSFLVDAARSTIYVQLLFCSVLHIFRCYSLRGNTVGMEGAKALANALKSNRSLKSLK